MLFQQMLQRFIPLFALAISWGLVASPLHDDPFKAVNKVFRDAYGVHLEKLKDQTRPLIVESAGRLYFYREDGSMENANTIDPIYHHLKTVAHMPLALCLMAGSGEGEAFSPETLQQLKDYRHLTEELKGALSQCDFSPAQLDRQKRLLQRAERFMEDCIQSGRAEKAQIKAYARDTADDVLANAHEAALSQLHNIHKQMLAWKKTMADDAWGRLRVSIAGIHMPRDGYLTMQYFALLLGEPYEGRHQRENMESGQFRLVYAEGGFERKWAFEELAKHLLDRDLGVLFFNDDRRMHRDLLADAAERILKDMFPRNKD